ncbi:MAG: tetratricopeptide repeat protein, partial [Myxococcota bacterium]
SVRYGGYLIWHLYPDVVPYIDGRLVLREPEQFAELLRVVDEPQQFDAFRDRYGFNYAVLPTAYPDRYRRLAAHLVRHPDWSLVATDGTEALFAFRGAGNLPVVELGDTAVSDRIVGELERRYATQSRVLRAAKHNLAAFLAAVGFATEARRILTALDDSTSRSLVARCYYLEGDLHLAESVAHDVLIDDEDDVPSLNLLARVAIDRGQPREALAFLRRVLDIDPYNERGSAMLRSLERQAGVGP